MCYIKFVDVQTALWCILYASMCQCEMYQGGSTCPSIIPAAACPRGPAVCFQIHVQAAGYPKASFSPLNTLTQDRKKTLGIINQERNTAKSHTGKSFSRTRVRWYLPFRSAGMYTVYHFSELHTHTHTQNSHESTHVQTHTVNTTNTFSSTNNNIPDIQLLIM